jgi:fatty acid desaturase
MISNSPNWYLGIGPPIIQCTTPNCGQWLRIKGANEWQFFAGHEKVIFVFMYGLSYLFQGAGAGAFLVFAWSYLKSKEVATEPLIICIALSILISIFILWFNLRKEIAESERRLENIHYRERVEYANSTKTKS